MPRRTPPFFVLSLAMVWGLTAAVAQEISLDPSAAVDTATPAPQTAVAGEAAQAAAATQAAPAPSAPRRTVARAAPGFVLRAITVSPSAYLDPTEIAAVQDGLRGRRISDARSVAQAVNALYAAKGILTAEAIVRSVDRRRGIVGLELLEARLGRVRTDAGLLSAPYLSYRLGLPSGALADNRVIEERVLRLRLTDGLPVQLGFAPGAERGQTDVILAQPEVPRHVTNITLNNYGPPSEGEAQLILSHTIRSLTGWNDPLNMSLTLREGAESVYLGYSRVITRGGGTLGLTLSHSQTETIRAPKFEGKESEVSLIYTQPVIVEENRRLSFSVGAAAFRETGNFLGVRTLDQRGHEVSLGAAWYQRGTGWSVSAAPRLVTGRYDDRVAGGGRRSYSAVELSAFVSRAIGSELVGSVALNAQRVLSGLMPSQRKFTVTSPSGVRGYPASLSSGDSGYYFRVQLEKATPFGKPGGVLLRPFGFVDVGEAFDSADTGLGLASSMGLGLSFGVGDRLFGDIYVAKPLTTDITGWAAPNDDPSLGVSFSLTF